ncbi:MAG: DUF1810 domain-containing protein [Sulfuricella sp.]|nr:DUF1810 domain-containing protein [Sulfuricella sp.]
MPSDLSRFIDAQRTEYEPALSELRSGKKRGHWMWFIFPQISGLGVSETSRYYGVANIDEATEYLNHPVLGRRLIDCTNAVMAISDSTIDTIFGTPDNLKFISSMSLFSCVKGAPEVFQCALDRFNKGNRDRFTVEILSKQANNGII